LHLAAQLSELRPASSGDGAAEGGEPLGDSTAT
jgi:hypothetical protein